jgi:hypothetical protein
VTDLQKLRAKLCRELVQSEHSARVHPARYARRLGNTPPGTALRAIVDHAYEIKPRLESLIRGADGLGAGRAIGNGLSAVRHLVIDPFTDIERSFRGTLLGLYHGVDVACLLRAVAIRKDDAFLAGFCVDLIAKRTMLIEHARQSMGWFAERPARSGMRVALAART